MGSPGEHWLGPIIFPYAPWLLVGLDPYSPHFPTNLRAVVPVVEQGRDQWRRITSNVG